MQRKPLTLRNNEERRLRAGHLWVFSNEVDTKKTPLTAFAPGEEALVTASRGRPLGVATVNPGSLICARIVDRDPETALSADFFRARLREALALRQRLYPTPHYSAARELDGLPRTGEVAYGDAPDHLDVEEDGARFAVPALGGQKTGWFYDMRENRSKLCRLVAGRTVLDLFAYAGAFGVRAALAGAAKVVCLDSSEAACSMAAENAARNGVADRVTVVRADAADYLEAAAAEGRTFDVVSLDPPALVKRKKDLEAGLKAYERFNRLAMDVVADGGLLMTCSCSQHVDAYELRRAALRAAAGRNLRAQILDQGRQGPDHPGHPAMAETEYLKSFILRLVRP